MTRSSRVLPSTQLFRPCFLKTFAEIPLADRWGACSQKAVLHMYWEQEMVGPGRQSDLLLCALQSVGQQKLQQGPSYHGLSKPALPLQISPNHLHSRAAM